MVGCQVEDDVVAHECVLKVQCQRGIAFAEEFVHLFRVCEDIFNLRVFVVRMEVLNSLHN